MRRGSQTLHRIHGIPLAINAGDALHGIVHQVLLENHAKLGAQKALQVHQHLNLVMQKTFEGQALDIGWVEKEVFPNREQYQQMIVRKTGWYSGRGPCQCGALIAGNYAKMHAELPALVLANPANGYGAADKETRAEKLLMRLTSMEKLGPKGLAAARSSVLLSDNASEGAQALVHWNMKKLNPIGYAQAAHMLTNAHLVGDAPSYAGPVLGMGGDKDTITPEVQCRLVADAYTNKRYKTLLDVGHASYIEDSLQFNKKILTFINDVYG